jgi:hypothetical protein
MYNDIMFRAMLDANKQHRDMRAEDESQCRLIKVLYRFFRRFPQGGRNGIAPWINTALSVEPK